MDGVTPRHLLCDAVHSAGSQLPLEGTERSFFAQMVKIKVLCLKTPWLISMASLLLSPDSPAPEGTSAEDGGGGEDGEDADAATAESRGVAGGVAGEGSGGRPVGRRHPSVEGVV